MGTMRSWDIYLNQMLTAVRFHVSETIHFSPYYLLYNRDIILPLDNISRPRRIYYGNEHYEIALQEVHCRKRGEGQWMSPLQRLRMWNLSVIWFTVEITIGERNGTYVVSHIMWLSKRLGPSHRIRYQLTGSVTKVYAEHLRAAFI